jgi:hypothetical protein
LRTNYTAPNEFVACFSCGTNDENFGVRREGAQPVYRRIESRAGVIGNQEFWSWGLGHLNELSLSKKFNQTLRYLSAVGASAVLFMFYTNDTAEARNSPR